jgi:hypothetical protein
LRKRRNSARKRRRLGKLRKKQLRGTMDKKAAELFIDEYVALCKRSGMYLWSGEPWYGLDLIDGDIDEEKNKKQYSYIR